MISGNIEKFNSPIRTISGKVELYTGSTPAHTFAHDDDLISFTIDRVGEGKFFGYGVCQKIELKLRDKERQYEVSGGRMKPFLDDLALFPLFYVKDAKRDENTNDLTITAYDCIEEANNHTLSELSITNYTLANIAQTIANKIGAAGVVCNYAEFNNSYDNGANVDGTETLREILDDIAEATQTIYYMDYDNYLVFKRLDQDDPVYTIDKSQYFILKSEPAKALTAIVSATELGDNVGTAADEGETQYVRDNVFWTLRDNVDELVDNALNNVNNTTITPFDCSWRGNYLVEIGDRIAITTKDNGEITTYLLNDKLTYNGGFSQHSQWVYSSGEETASNPTTLGEVLKQTFAKVDKANKQIDLLVSEVDATNQAMAYLRLNTDSISASVSEIEKKEAENAETINTLTQKVEAQITAEDITFEITNALANGVNSVETTTGFKFNEDGLTVSNSDSDISTTITEDGMSVQKGSEKVLTANNEGVKAIDLHATTYLVIGTNSRIEDYGSDRTACFWIGR
jgi:hypothetical protein